MPIKTKTKPKTQNKPPPPPGPPPPDILRDRLQDPIRPQRPQAPLVQTVQVSQEELDRMRLAWNSVKTTRELLPYGGTNQKKAIEKTKGQSYARGMYANRKADLASEAAKGNAKSIQKLAKASVKYGTGSCDGFSSTLSMVSEADGQRADIARVKMPKDNLHTFNLLRGGSKNRKDWLVADAWANNGGVVRWEDSRWSQQDMIRTAAIPGKSPFGSAPKSGLKKGQEKDRSKKYDKQLPGLSSKDPNLGKQILDQAGTFDNGVGDHGIFDVDGIGRGGTHFAYYAGDDPSTAEVFEDLSEEAGQEMTPRETYQFLNGVRRR